MTLTEGPYTENEISSQVAISKAPDMQDAIVLPQQYFNNLNTLLENAWVKG